MAVKCCQSDCDVQSIAGSILSPVASKCKENLLAPGVFANFKDKLSVLNKGQLA